MMMEAACRLVLALACALGASCVSFDPQAKKNTHVLEGPGETVVLVHGLRWWTQDGMDSLGRRLNKDGYRVVIVEYPSRTLEGEEIIRRYMDTAVKEHVIPAQRPFHVVAHSMGSVLSHAYLQDAMPANLGRVVFIATPHAGTEIADIAGRNSIARRLAGPAVASLRTTESPLRERLREPRFPLGVIMGDRSRYPFLSPLINGSDDGAVPVNGGRIPGAQDFIVLHEGHLDMLRSDETFAQVRHFLREGSFDRSREVPRGRRLGHVALLAVGKL